MAISIGKSGTLPPTVGPVPEQDAPTTENNAVARQGLKDGQKAHTKGQTEKIETQKEQAKHDASLKNDGPSSKGATAALATSFKDALITDNGAALLEALASAVSTQHTQEPTGNDDGVAALTTVKPLLGKPNGLPVPEKPFEHKELEALATMPAGISPEATQTLVSINDLQKTPSSETTQWFARVLTDTGALPELKNAPVTSEAALKIKDMISYINKLRAMSDKLATNPNLPAPTVPKAVAQLIADNLPQIQNATKQFWKALESGKKTTSDEIEIPSDVVVQLEKALMPSTSKYLELLEKVQTAAASPKEMEALAMAMSAEQSGTALQSANKYTSLAKELVMVKPDKDWKLQKVDTSISKALLNNGNQGSSGSGKTGGSSGSSASSGVSSGGMSTTIGQSEVFGGRFSGVDFLTADLEGLIYFVLMQSTASEGEMLRDQIIEVSNNNKQKEQLRNLQTKMKKERAECETAMRNEYDYLVSQGAITGDVTFDTYKEWRQVTWTPEGDAALQQPMPDLPDHFIFGPGGPPQPPEGSNGQTAGIGGDPTMPPLEPPELRKALAEKYGCDEADVAYLHSYYQWCMQNGSESWGMDGATIAEKGFEGFLKQMGLVEGENNQAHIDSLMGNQIRNDVPPSTDAEGGGTASPTAQQANSATVSDATGKSSDTLSKELGALLSQPPYSDNPTIKHALESILAQLKSMYPHGIPDLANPGKMIQVSDPEQYLKIALARMYSPPAPGSDDNSEKLAGHFAKLQQGLQEVDASLGLKPPGSTGTVSFVVLSEKVLADIKFWKTHVVWVQNDLEYKSPDPFYAVLIDRKKNSDKVKPAHEVAVTFFNQGMKTLNPLFNTITIKELEKQATDQGYADAAASAPPPTDPATDPVAPFGQGLYDQWLVAQQAEKDEKRAIEDARKAAEEAVKKGHDAAQEGSQALQGAQTLNNVEGAQTGSLASMDAAMEETKNKMDSLSELNELGSMRLQMIMDRRQKLLETLSNVMKKISSTKETINQNLKG